MKTHNKAFQLGRQFRWASIAPVNATLNDRFWPNADIRPNHYFHPSYPKLVFCISNSESMNLSKFNM